MTQTDMSSATTHARGNGEPVTERPYHHGELKQALVRAGLELLEERGLADLSLRAIAARVGVSHTAPKNHFDGLQGLLAAIAAEGFRLHATEMRRNVEDQPPGRERLEAAAEGYVRFARRHPALFALMFSPRFKNCDDAELQAAAMASYGVLEQISEGLIWPTRQGQAAQTLQTELMLWSLVHGYASLVNEGRMPRDEDGEPVLGILDVMPMFDYRADDSRC